MIIKGKTRVFLGLAALLSPFSPAFAQNTDGCDYTDAALYGGWGWNSATNQSCAPLTNTTPTNPITSNTPFCDDPDGDGWGWDGTGSCQTTVVVNNPVPGTPTDSSCVDTPPLGNGWGWNGTQSCRVGIVNNDPVNTAICNDPDGDGWGWDGTGSCRVVDPVTPVNPVNPVVGVTPSDSECLDPDGDGYGWNGTSSCVADQTNIQPPTSVATSECEAPAPGTVEVSSTTPVRSTGNAFYPDRGPQCVWPENRFNGPGLRFGDFLVINNAWNGDKSTHDWLQCIQLTETNGRVNPSWTYDWGNEDDLLPGFFEWEVKSYPEIIYGAKSREVQSASCEETGLPVTYSAMPQIDIAYSYRSTQTDNRVGDFGPENNNPVPVTGGDRNIAIESFLHSSCDIRRGADSNREFELMVWLDIGPERGPSGRPPVSVYTDTQGRSFDVYVKGAADPGYIAYVAQQEQTSGTLNWNEFFTDAQNNAGRYGVNRIQNDWCLGNILLGTEIWWGEGTMALDTYDITRSY